MDKQESLSEVLYVRIRPSIDKWIPKEMKRLGFKSKSKLIDSLLGFYKGQATTLDKRKKRSRDSKKGRV